MIEWLKPNQPVVCISHDRFTAPHPPVKDQVYVIDRVLERNGTFYIALSELPNDFAWHFVYFRPARPTNISSLLKIAQRTPELV